MQELLKQLDGLDRRSFIEYTAKSMLGVSLVPTLGEAVAAAPTAAGANRTGKRLIYLFMTGAMSHLDTFDLKPGHENQGETRPIKTNVAGHQISEFLPGLATQFDKLAVVRSMYTETGAHEPGQYLMHTSYKMIATTRHPWMGPWMQKALGRQNKELPDSVVIGGAARHPGAGFLEPSYSPLPIGDANLGLQNTSSPAYLTDESFNRRRRLIDTFDKKFRSKFKLRDVQAYTDYYAQATRLLASQELKAFDLNQEKDALRDEYGRDPLGQGCLLARRLIENNVRCVEVTFGGWDMHRSIYNAESLPARTSVLDRALSNLLRDLESRGLLDDTLVVLTTEFGRSPRINQNAGRDHHPGVFSCALAGGGIKGGRFYGKSDEDGHLVEDDGVLPADFNATIAHALNLPLEKEFYSPSGRPFRIANDGEAVTSLF